MEVSVMICGQSCWSYIPLELNASGDAPQLHAGFNSVKYPADDFNPGLRIGLSQIESTSVSQPIKVNLRGAQLVSAGASYIGMITSISPDAYSKYILSTQMILDIRMILIFQQILVNIRCR